MLAGAFVEGLAVHRVPRIHRLGVVGRGLARVAVMGQPGKDSAEEQDSQSQ
jgi:hypothetical protein